MVMLSVPSQYLDGLQINALHGEARAERVSTVMPTEICYATICQCFFHQMRGNLANTASFFLALGTRPRSSANADLTVEFIGIVLLL